MKTKSNNYYDRSPEISLEDRLEHERKAMRFNYEIALDELEFLMNRSKLQLAYVKANKQNVWKDQKGRVWACDKPITEAERTSLNAVLEVIKDYESGRTLEGIRNVREKGGEKGKNRLNEFNKHEAVSKSNPSIDMQVQSRDEHEDMER